MSKRLADRLGLCSRTLQYSPSRLNRYIVVLLIIYGSCARHAILKIQVLEIVSTVTNIIVSGHIFRNISAHHVYDVPRQATPVVFLVLSLDTKKFLWTTKYEDKVVRRAT